MTNAELSGLVAPWPGVSQDLKWGEDLVFSVAGKMFCVRQQDAAPDTPLSLKVPPERFLELTAQPGFEPAPYLARAGWLRLQPARLSRSELEAMLRTSYELVRARLSKRVQHELAD
jgi:predicted DNA-binding protein (MmcQ/YjbR family)